VTQEKQASPQFIEAIAHTCGQLSYVFTASQLPCLELQAPESRDFIKPRLSGVIHDVIASYVPSKYYSDMIRVTRTIAIDESDLVWDFVRASGPGGQHVNKVATAAQLRWDTARATGLADDVRERLRKLAGRRMTADGVLMIVARRYRSQERNRDDALGRLVALVRKAAQRPKPRRKTKPTRASRERRLDEKRHRGNVKRTRRRVRKDED
jgi:ribosome-associated protein